MGAVLIAGSILVSVDDDEAEPADAAVGVSAPATDEGGVSQAMNLPDVLAGYARQVGLDEANYEQCMATESNVDILNTHIGRARTYGVSATPTFIINNKKVVGSQPPSIFAEIIDAELKGAPATVEEYSSAIQQLANAGRFEILDSRPDVSDAEVEGDRDARVMIAEFSDFQCPFCKRWVDQSLGGIREMLGDDVALAFVHFPIQQIHPNAPFAHVASVCAAEQGKFWEMHDVLFARQEEWAQLSR